MDMDFFSQAESIAFLDCIACMLLSAAASARARTYGAHFTGAAILGCICGLAGPLAREIILHGEEGGLLVISLLPDDALLGALAGVAAVLPDRKLPVEFWLDSLSVSLASSLGCLLTMQNNGIVAGLCLGLVSAFLPGIIRDASLGDMAAIVERDWYATSAAIGCMAAILLFMAPFFVSFMSFMENYLLEAAVIAGALISFVLQLYKGRKNFKKF